MWGEKSGVWDCCRLARKVGECQLWCTHLTRPLLNPPDLVTGVCTIIDSEYPNLSQSWPAGWHMGVMTCADCNSKIAKALMSVTTGRMRHEMGLGMGQNHDAVGGGGLATTIHAPHHTSTSLLHIGYTGSAKLEETSIYFILVGCVIFFCIPLRGGNSDCKVGGSRAETSTGVSFITELGILWTMCHVSNFQSVNKLNILAQTPMFSLWPWLLLVAMSQCHVTVQHFACVTNV
jgi:hypothetical protein